MNTLSTELTNGQREQLLEDARLTPPAVWSSGDDPDSDLVSPIRMVRDELKKPVGILNPQRLSGPNFRPPRKNAGLQQAASFYQNGVTWAQLQAAQFPPSMTDATGTFHKPPAWA